jgi:uncharacterized protein YbjT (DUF2867 family)
MKVLLFGATGMVGHGALSACLDDPGVTAVVSIGRRASGRVHPRLEEIVQPDISDIASHETLLRDVDACFFCLGVSSVGMNEERYTAVTYDLTMAVARALVRIAPGATFIYVSGLGTDSTEKGRTMWARVKGRTENALLALPFRAAYMFRPGMIQPVRGAPSRTLVYRALYVAAAPLIYMMRRIAPDQVPTTIEVGRAMIAATRHGYPERLIAPRDIARLARQGT